MNVFFRLTSWGLLILGSLVWGEEGTGRCRQILLRDATVIEGQVTQQGETILILTVNARIRLPRDRVLCWADSIDGLYQYQLDHHLRNDFSSHLALAQWSLRNQFARGATEQIAAAAALRPQDPNLRYLREQLRQQEAMRTAGPPEPVPFDSADVASTPLIPAGFEEAAEEKSVTRDAATDPAPKSPSTAKTTQPLAADELRLFATEIQPILTNRCAMAGCHDRGSTSRWHLLTAPGLGNRISAQGTRQNYWNTLRWIDPNEPSSSPLLVRAKEAHGGISSPPLGNRDRLAIEQLQRWSESLGARAAATQSPLASGTSIASLPATARPSKLAPDNDPPHGSSSQEHGSEGKRTEGLAPARLPTIDDPFDPELFNRLFRGNPPNMQTP